MEQSHNDSHWPMNCTDTLNCTNLTADVIEFVRNETCTNDYCETDDDYIDRIEAYMFPSVYEWILIGLHCMVFIVGLVGNFLVCLAVYRNHTMRTVTNMFIVNLAIADFLVIFLCLPPTVLWDITETWFMGSTLCKIIPYFQHPHNLIRFSFPEDEKDVVLLSKGARLGGIAAPADRLIFFIFTARLNAPTAAAAATAHHNTESYATTL